MPETATTPIVELVDFVDHLVDKYLGKGHSVQHPQLAHEIRRLHTEKHVPITELETYVRQIALIRVVGDIDASQMMVVAADPVTIADRLGKIIFRLETNFGIITRLLDGLPEDTINPAHAHATIYIRRDFELLKDMKDLLNPPPNDDVKVEEITDGETEEDPHPAF